MSGNSFGRVVCIVAVSASLGLPVALAQPSLPRVLPAPRIDVGALGAVELDLNHCDPATFDRCMSQNYPGACVEQFERQNECSNIVQAAADRSYVRFETEPTPLPAGLDLDGSVTDAAVAPDETPAGNELVLPDYTSWSSVRNYMLAVAQIPLGDPRAQAATNLYSFWNANGNAVASCDEYVYEKFYDLRAFEWTAARNGSDYAATMYAAFGPARNRDAVGTRHLDDLDLRGKDGRVFGRLMDNGEVKNAFFETPAWIRTELEGYLDDRPRGGIVYYGISAMDLSAYRGIEEEVRLNPTALSKLRENRGVAPIYRRTPRWFLNNLFRMGLLRRTQPLRRADGTQVANGYFPDELDWLDELQDHYRNVLAEYGENHEQMLSIACGRDRVCTLAENRSALESEHYVALAERQTTMRGQIIRMLNTAQSYQCLERSEGPCDISPRRFYRWITNFATGSAAAQEAAYQSCLANTPRPDSLYLGLGNARYPAITGFCATGNGRGAQCNGGRCTSRYADGALCRADGYRWSQWKGAIEGDQTRDPQTLENFMARWPAYRTAAADWQIEQRAGRLRAIPELVDPRTGNIRAPQWADNGGDFFGKKKYVGAGYSWSTSWNVASSRNICRLHGTVQADFDSEIWLANHSLSIADFRAAADIHHVSGHGRVLGRNLFDPFSEDVLEGNEELINVVVSEDVERDWDYGFGFPIGPATLDVTVGAAGQIGFEGQVEGQTQGFDSDRDCQMNGLRAYIKATARPFVKFTAFADAGLDAFVAKAGIRGDLDLIDVKLPFSMAITLQGNAANAPTLSVDSRVTLDWSMLGGRFRAYLRLGHWPVKKTFRKTIVSWDGLHPDPIEVGHSVFRINADDLVTYLNR